MKTYRVTFSIKELGLFPAIQVKTIKTLKELKQSYKGHFLGTPEIIEINHE